MDSSERIAKWEARYRAGERGNPKPSPVVILASSELQRRRVEGAAATGRALRALDLACGAGRNALFLARNGWEVVAVDGAPSAVDLVRRRASLIGVTIDARTLDLEAHGPLPFDNHSSANAAFDLVCIAHFLHRPLIAEAKRIAAAVAIEIATEASHGFTLEPGELRAMFADWTIEHAREERGVAELFASAALPAPTSSAG